MVTILATSNAQLVLRADERGWCSVDLSIDGRTVRLGAEQYDVVVERLASAMDELLKGEVVGTMDGKGVARVLSLFEAHGTIFVSDTEGQRSLFFQDASGLLIGSVSLTASERIRWFEQLRTERSS